MNNEPFSPMSIDRRAVQVGLMTEPANSTNQLTKDPPYLFPIGSVSV